MRIYPALVCFCAAACTQPAPPRAEPEAPAAAAVPALATPASTDVIIVGGGLAGLVTAYELQKRGIATHLLEAKDYVGGRVATAEYGNGLRAEYGMQEMWEGNPLLDIAKELGLALDEGQAAYSSIVLDGKLVPYIQDTHEEFWKTFLSVAEIVALKDWMQKAHALADLAEKEGLKNAQIRDLQSMTFQAWLEELKLPAKVAYWLHLTLSCELGIGWDKYSALSGLLEFHTFYDGGVPNFHITGGNSRLIEALAKKAGGITTSATVTAIERKRNGSAGVNEVRVTYVQERQTHTISGKRVVVAIPFVHLHQLQIEPPLPDVVWQGLWTLGLSQYVVVHLIVAKAAEKLWMLDGESPFAVLSDGPLGVIYGPAGTSSSTTHDVFSLLIYGAAARAFHMVPRETKLREISEELDKLWPGLSGHVQDSHVYTYHPAAIPHWPAGRSPLDESSQAIRQPHLGLHLVGDYTLNSHSDGAARSALAVAKQLALELGAK